MAVESAWSACGDDEIGWFYKITFLCPSCLKRRRMTHSTMRQETSLQLRCKCGALVDVVPYAVKNSAA